MIKLFPIGYLLVGLLSPILLGLGTLMPISQTSLGFNYIISNHIAMLFYFLAIVILAINIFSDKINLSIARRIMLLPLAISVGFLLFSYNQLDVSNDYYLRQTAYSAPEIKNAKLISYWKMLDDFGAWKGLQGAYTAYGPTVEFNGAPIFLDTINALSHEQINLLLDKSDVHYSTSYPGLIAFLTAMFLQLALFFMILKKRPADESLLKDCKPSVAMPSDQ